MTNAETRQEAMVTSRTFKHWHNVLSKIWNKGHRDDNHLNVFLFILKLYSNARLQRYWSSVWWKGLNILLVILPWWEFFYQDKWAVWKSVMHFTCFYLTLWLEGQVQILNDFVCGLWMDLLADLVMRKFWNCQEMSVTQN